MLRYFSDKDSFFWGKRNSEEAGRWSDFIQNLTKLPEAEIVLDEETGAETEPNRTVGFWLTEILKTISESNRIKFRFGSVWFSVIFDFHLNFRK